MPLRRDGSMRPLFRGTGGGFHAGATAGRGPAAAGALAVGLLPGEEAGAGSGGAARRGGGPPPERPGPGLPSPAAVSGFLIGLKPARMRNRKHHKLFFVKYLDNPSCGWPAFGRGDVPARFPPSFGHPSPESAGRGPAGVRMPRPPVRAGRAAPPGTPGPLIAAAPGLAASAGSGGRSAGSVRSRPAGRLGPVSGPGPVSPATR
jgi:hypothetical protein